MVLFCFVLVVDYQFPYQMHFSKWSKNLILSKILTVCHHFPISSNTEFCNKVQLQNLLSLFVHIHTFANFFNQNLFNRESCFFIFSRFETFFEQHFWKRTLWNFLIYHFFKIFRKIFHQFQQFLEFQTLFKISMIEFFQSMKFCNFEKFFLEWNMLEYCMFWFLKFFLRTAVLCI